MEKIVRRAKKLGIDIQFFEIECDGVYLAPERTIIVRQSLNEQSMKEVILHELKHALSHEDYMSLYDQPVYRSKMEFEANDYAINYLIEENEGIFNYSQLIEEFDIGIGWDTKFTKII